MRFGDFLSFDYRVESGAATEDVIRLSSQHFTKSVTRTVTKECPDFHLPETLSTVLSFAPQRLLSDDGVRADGAHVYLVFNHVVKFKDIHVADSDLLIKCLAGATIEKVDLAGFFKVCFDEFFFNLFFGRTGKWRHNRLIIESVRRKT